MTRGYRFFVLVILMLALIGSSLAVVTPLPPLIRLHVVANSNSFEDQNLKLAVKNKCVQYVQERLRHSGSLEESRERLLDSLAGIEGQAQETIEKAGYDYRVRAVYGQYDFPTKYYGALTLPAGRYEALRVVIGEGRGANWWCVLFPPLCFVEGRTQENFVRQETARRIEESLPQGKVLQVKPAYKVAELWQEVAARIASGGSVATVKN